MFIYFTTEINLKRRFYSRFAQQKGSFFFYIYEEGLWLYSAYKLATSHQSINKMEVITNEDILAIWMDMAMGQILRSGQPIYPKLLCRFFSQNDCKDCRGVIKGVKGHISLAGVMVNHLSYDRTSHRVEVRFILNRDLPIGSSALQWESNVASMLRNITEHLRIFISVRAALLHKNILCIALRQVFKSVH